MKKLKLIETKRTLLSGDAAREIVVYNIGHYKVRAVYYHSNFMNLIVLNNDGTKYLPDIFAIDDEKGNIVNFRIQTTSYGSLAVEEIEKVVALLKESISVVEILKKEFIKPTEEKTFYVYMDSPCGTELLGKSNDINVAEEIKAKKDAEWKTGYLWHTRISETEEKEITCWD